MSRQRFAGVAFPVWYPVRGDGSIDYAAPILADAADLPLDPLASPPRGRREDERGKPGGFIGDPDVMDTWATSSMSPQIISGWGRDPQRHQRLFPMDLRPQSHEIIRTWAFYTIVKAWLHERTDSLAAHHHQRLGGRPRPQEDVEVEGQCGDAAASLPRALGRRLSLLGGAQPARHRHHLRPRGDPRRQALWRPSCSTPAASCCRSSIASAPTTRGCRSRTSPRSSTSRWSPICARWSRARPPPSTTSTTRCRCRPPRSCSGGSATTSSSW